jgi:hypothetical protein
MLLVHRNADIDTLFADALSLSVCVQLLTTIAATILQNLRHAVALPCTRTFVH